MKKREKGGRVEFSSHSEQDPKRDRLHREAIERLPDSPSTRSPMAQMASEAFRAAALEANTLGAETLDDGIDLLTYLLAVALPPGSELQKLATIGEIDPTVALEECNALLSRPTLYPEAREATNWVAAHFVSRLAPELAPSRPINAEGWEHSIAHKDDLGLTLAVHFPKGTPMPASDELMSRLENFALAHGLPAVAHLRRPSVDATSDTIEKDLNRDYFHAYNTLEEAIDHFVQIRQISDDGVSDPIPYDLLDSQAQTGARQTIAAHWEFVPYEGMIYVFRRPT